MAVRRERRRPYNSPERKLRALQTRARIVSAAHELFLERGYFPTTVRAIAETAGVAEKTVYLAFASKPALLDAVIDAAIAAAQDQPPRSDAATIYALVNETVYMRLTDAYGWSTQAFADWLEHLLRATLTIAPPSRKP